MVGLNAAEQFLDVEFVRSDAIDGRNGAAEDVVGAVVLLGLFDGVDVERFFDDQNGASVALRGVIEGRNRLVGINEGKSDGAGLDAGVKIDEGFGDVGAETGAVFEQKIGVALGGARADAWEMPEGFDYIR